jgi:hypothetical protein
MAQDAPPIGWLVLTEEVDALSELRRYVYMDGTAINVVIPRARVQTSSDAWLAAFAYTNPPPPPKP